VDQRGGVDHFNDGAERPVVRRDSAASAGR